MQKVRQLLISKLLSDLKMFLKYKKYHLNDLIYIQMIIRVLKVYEIMEIIIVKYKVENLNNQLNFLFLFKNNYDSLLYIVIINIYLTLIIRFLL